MRNFLFCLLGIALSSGCGTANKFSKKDTKDADESIRVAIDDKDFETARDLLKEQIDLEPEAYERYALLGGVYAQLANFDLLKAVENPPSSSDSLLDSVDAFLPDNIDSDVFDQMQNAIDILTNIPEDQRQISSDQAYGAAAAFQLTLYNAAFSLMTLRQYISVDPATQKLDTTTLSKMDEKDAEKIVDGLLAAAQAGGTSGLGDSVDTAIKAINDTPGDTTRDKVINYVATQKKSG